MKITSTVVSVQVVEGQDFLKVWLESSMSFIINREDPALRKFTKGYTLTVDVQSITVGFAKPSADHSKSIKGLLDFIKNIKGYINLKGTKIIDIQLPAITDTSFEHLPDITSTGTNNDNSHLRLAANGGVRV